MSGLVFAGLLATESVGIWFLWQYEDARRRKDLFIGVALVVLTFVLVPILR